MLHPPTPKYRTGLGATVSPSASVEELVRPRGPLGLPIPAYDGASIVNIAPTIAGALGVRHPEGGPALAPPLRTSLDPFKGRRAEGTTVVLLIDGFGWSSFVEALAETQDPLTAAWRNLAQPITTVFPTTTVAALTSLSTGTPPARHGSAGYRLYLPGYGLVADLLKMSAFGVSAPGGLVGPAWTPRMVSGVPAIFGSVPGSAVVSRDHFESTGFTRILYEGAEYLPYATASDLAYQLIDALTRPRPPPLIYAYWDELDTVHHLHGPATPLYRFEFERIAHMVDFVARSVGPVARTTTWIATGDHGQLPSLKDRQIYVDTFPDLLAEMARPMAGDRRGAYFAAHAGREEALRAALDAHLPAGSRIVGMGEALSAGLFGPPPWHPEIRSRLGDWLALVPPTYGIVHRLPGSTPPRRYLAGSHGGLNPRELLVPLVAGRLSDFSSRV